MGAKAHDVDLRHSGPDIAKNWGESKGQGFTLCLYAVKVSSWVFDAAPVCFPDFIASSFNPSCYERDNGYKTHLAKRLGLLQGHYKNDYSLVEGIRKQKREAI
jgi:hypothetical protein